VKTFEIVAVSVGWCGIGYVEEKVARLWLPMKREGDLMLVVNQWAPDARLTDGQIPSPIPDLAPRISTYFNGEPVSFDDVMVVAPTTPFACRVVEALRQVKWGETISYGRLATQAGSPHGARAVGKVMASNQIPLIIPCHRVLARDGNLCGFSAEGGVAMKKMMVEIEMNKSTPLDHLIH
jgi:methylated-DNA-[protein]-cysteine S-methyltransferase